MNLPELRWYCKLIDEISDLIDKMCHKTTGTNVINTHQKEMDYLYKAVKLGIDYNYELEELSAGRHIYHIEEGIGRITSVEGEDITVKLLNSDGKEVILEYVYGAFKCPNYANHSYTVGISTDFN